MCGKYTSSLQMIDKTDTVNAEIFIGDEFSWASISKKIRPTKICTHEESATVYNYGGLLLPTKINPLEI